MCIFKMIFTVFGFVIFLQLPGNIFRSVCSLRLTNMTAPLLQDPRQDMMLHCRFDMGGEDLYAVKWYKDDHEFFRYTPVTHSTTPILQFPVVGVNIDITRTKCTSTACDLVLTSLSRPHSSGAYRCEVSSEAPAFRLASQTHNVTVAVIPDTGPDLEGLAPGLTYVYEDVVLVTCTTGWGDPRPTITWYINGHLAAKKYVSKEMIRSPNDQSHSGSVVMKLSAISSQLRLPLTEKIAPPNQIYTNIEIACVSSVEGVSTTVIPTRNVTRIITVTDRQQYLINTQRFLSSSSSASIRTGITGSILLSLLLVLW